MADAPEGFKLVKYDTPHAGEVDLFVCSKCKPQWDTYDRAEAKQHTEAGVHNPELHQQQNP